MIIDVHTHFFPDSLAPRALQAVVEATHGEMRICGDGTLNGLLGEMRSQEISYAVTLPVATRPDQVEGINSHLPLHQPTILPFGSLNPNDVSWPQRIDELVQLGVRGVKLHPEFQDFYIDDPQYTPFFEYLSQAHLWVLTHAGYDPGPFTCDHATPDKIATLLDRHPHLKLIAGHLGGLCQWDDVELHLVGRSLYFDTAAIASLISTEQFVHIVRMHGVEKVLFGSDYPWESPKETLAFIRRSGLDAEEVAMILGLNAQKLFGV